MRASARTAAERRASAIAVPGTVDKFYMHTTHITSGKLHAYSYMPTKNLRTLAHWTIY